jgi:NAD(P)H dehydrogenase (quinone)
MPLFAITGITGHVGRVAARRLLTDGAGVRAVARDEAKAAPWRKLGPNSPSPTCAQHPSGTGAILKLHHMEQAFADLPGVVSIRAGWFMENCAGLIPHVRATGVLPSMLAPLDRDHPLVATQDVGTLVANILIDNINSRVVIELEGPRRYAPRDAADVFAKVLGQPVVAKVLPPAEWLDTFAQWGLTPRSAEAMSEMLAGFNSGHIAFERGQHDRIRGQTTLETVLADRATR